MLILIPSLVLLLTALLLVALRLARPNSRFNWFIAVGGSILALLVVLFWQGRMPLQFSLPPWQPQGLFDQAPSFRADGLSWLYVFSLATLNLAILLIAVAGPSFSHSFAWAGTLALSAVGLLAVSADNPLTLLLLWGALDITELIAQLRAVDGPSASERVVISFSSRVLGVGLLMWANLVSISAGSPLDFDSLSQQASLYLIAAAGLRLGVLPLHLPYPSESSRRGFGTALRLVSAASSLVLLAHISGENISSPFTLFLLGLTAIAALYGGWMWLRAPDELTGRPFWIIGLAALAVSSALTANSVGTVAWGCALVLTGGALFLSSSQHLGINRALLIGAWTLSSLPFSLTAGAWQRGNYGLFLPLFVIAQALIMAGYIRHALRPGGRENFEVQLAWAHNIYPAGISLLLLAQLMAGLLGWNGARQFGFWPAALAASLLTLGLTWAAARLRLLNPVRAHWVKPASFWLDSIYRNLWGLYRLLGRLSTVITETLEGASGVMWTLLFLVLFISLITRGS